MPFLKKEFTIAIENSFHCNQPQGNDQPDTYVWIHYMKLSNVTCLSAILGIWQRALIVALLIRLFHTQTKNKMRWCENFYFLNQRIKYFFIELFQQ